MFGVVILTDTWNDGTTKHSKERAVFRPVNIHHNPSIPLANSNHNSLVTAAAEGRRHRRVSEQALLCPANLIIASNLLLGERAMQNSLSLSDCNQIS